MRLKSLHESTVTGVIIEGWGGNLLRAGVLGTALATGMAGSVKAADLTVTPFGGTGAAINDGVPTDYEVLDFPRLDAALKSSKGLKIMDTKAYGVPTSDFNAIDKMPMIDRSKDVWNQIRDYYYSTLLPEHVYKAGLPVSPTTCIIYYLIGEKGIKDLQQKHKEKWMQSLPQEVKDVVITYINTKVKSGKHR